MQRTKQGAAPHYYNGHAVYTHTWCLNPEKRPMPYGIAGNSLQQLELVLKTKQKFPTTKSSKYLNLTRKFYWNGLVISTWAFSLSANYLLSHIINLVYQLKVKLGFYFRKKSCFSFRTRKYRVAKLAYATLWWLVIYECFCPMFAVNRHYHCA